MPYQRKKKETKPYVVLREHDEGDEHFKLRKEYTSLTWKNRGKKKEEILKKLRETK